MLVLEATSAGYGGLEVLHGVDMQVGAGQATVVLGSNGAGKTTLCRAISGQIAFRGGALRLDDADLTRTTARERVRRGIVHVPEGRQVFPQMTVLENLRLGAYVHGEPTAAALEAIYTYFPILRDRRDQHAGLLSGGEQQMLAVGRGLMGRPRYLLLDEPSQGLAPKVVDQIGEVIEAIVKDGVAVLLVEQNIALAEMIADYAYVLELGRIVGSGEASSIFSDERIAHSYLGH
jgi:branched-chain amino acid transport system ATP-binding protein